MVDRKREDEMKDLKKDNRPKGVFDGLVIYINGSTHPLISDHKLKHVLAENGGKVSLHLGRRHVSHVILGKPGSGAGGGLAASKVQKEIKRIGGCDLKYVSVEWYRTLYSFTTITNSLFRALESLKAGKRLSETPYTILKVAAKSQQSVYSMFTKSSSTDSES